MNPQSQERAARIIDPVVWHEYDKGRVTRRVLEESLRKAAEILGGEQGFEGSLSQAESPSVAGTPSPPSRVYRALENVLWWAKQRCPCDNDLPKICPLCDADVDATDERGRCKAADVTFPPSLLREIEAALDEPKAVVPSAATASPQAQDEPNTTSGAPPSGALR